MDAPHFNNELLLRSWHICLEVLSPNELEIAKKLLSYYDGKNFHVSSVYSSPPPDDPDIRFSQFTRKVLDFVNIGFHVTYAADALRSLVDDRRILNGVAMLAVLGCDLAMVPMYRQQVTTNHALTSRSIVEMLLRGTMDPSRLGNILNAIRMHHEDVDNNSRDFTIVCSLVRKAHQLARVKQIHEIDPDCTDEIAAWRKFKLPQYIPAKQSWYKHADSSTSMDFSWFEHETFTRELIPLINRTRPDEFIHLTKKEVALVSVETLLKIFRKIALEKGWKEILIYEGEQSERWRIVTLLTERFLSRSLLAEEYLGKDGRLGRFYVEYASGKTWTPKLIPFRLERIVSEWSIIPKNMPAWAMIKRISPPRNSTNSSDNAGWEDTEW